MPTNRFSVTELTREQILEHLRRAYQLRPRHITLVPGRLHAAASAYRIDCDGDSYFLKLSPPPPPTGLALARYLADAGISSVPAPLRTTDGQLATDIGPMSATLYPFVDGENGFERPLAPEQWRALGGAVRAIHSLTLLSDVRDALRVETYSEVWRREVRQYLTQPAVATDAVARDLMALLSTRRTQITALVEHAERLAASVQRKHLPLVPCHGDLHAGNVLVGAGILIAIVDWDDPVLAPKERDLMFVGGGIGGVWNREEEPAAFYRGYGGSHRRRRSARLLPLRTHRRGRCRLLRPTPRPRS